MKRNILKKIGAYMAVLCMLMSLWPVSVLANPDETVDENKMIFSKSDSARDIYDSICYALKLGDERLKIMAKDAYDFVLNEKTWESQGEKIVEFIQT